MAPSTQRVAYLKENFMQYHNAGYTISEIAKIFDLDDSTIYNHLDEIAHANNVTLASLLEKPKSSHNVTSAASFRRDKVQIEQLERDFNSIATDLEKVIATLDDLSTQQ